MGALMDLKHDEQKQIDFIFALGGDPSYEKYLFRAIKNIAHKLKEHKSKNLFFLEVISYLEKFIVLGKKRQLSCESKSNEFYFNIFCFYC